MKVPTSEARRRLPKLVRQVQQDPTLTVEILVRDEPVAELRAIRPHPMPGEAARKLLVLARRLAKSGARAAASNVSETVKDHLYGPGGIIR